MIGFLQQALILVLSVHRSRLRGLTVPVCTTRV
jgi:hypothetical protein